MMSNTAESMSGLSSQQKRALLEQLLRKNLQEKQAAREQLNDAQLPQIVPDSEKRYEPFPLTDIQQAYWVGRSSAFEIGSVGIHGYFEIESVDLDIEQLGQAWQCVINRHDMLRAIVLPDGRQQILEKSPAYKIEVIDLRGHAPSAASSKLDSIRRRLSHQLFAPDLWPMFEIKASRLDERRFLIHISIDGMHFDLWSISILFQDWIKFYETPSLEPRPLELSYRDYALALESLKSAPAYANSLNYWRERLKTLPAAPKLPLNKTIGAIEQAQFARRSARLEAESWQCLKQQAARYGLTPSGVLLACYAETLGAYSESLRFTINVTLANRLPLHPEVNSVAGDFTSMTLLEVDNSGPSSFKERAIAIQDQLWTDLQYRYVSGVEVLRERARMTGKLTDAIMPIVYTGTLGTQGYLSLNGFGKINHCITQTPQVLLDQQVFEEDGALLFSWDAVDEAFTAGFLDDMFEAYCRLLGSLAEGESRWVSAERRVLSEAQLKQIVAINDTDKPFTETPLQTFFERHVAENPHHVAVITSERCLTYSQLDKLSNRVGNMLRQAHVTSNTLVGVVMEKGWEQAVAMLGILKAGAAYLPVDGHFPQARIDYLLENGKLDLALTQSRINERIKWPDSVRHFCVDRIESESTNDQPLLPACAPEDLAYVIYTSGSTGFPKGVMIEQRSVINRMTDVCQRFRLGPEDKALGLTALQHDLSVFDFLGMIAVAGGSVVLPDAALLKDPAHWADLIEKHTITIWNSVPAFMEMLVEYLERRPERAAASYRSLRLVLLSGDWIPVSLPDRIRAIFENAQVVSLGGPTETTVWDVCYTIQSVDPSWKSIPYGRPMANAHYYVLSELLEPCPVWVPGELYLGGAGLARGYWQDDANSSARFFNHPRTGERLYRSGDMGRYLPDGNIEFLGRKDSQIKIRGHRIEPGEIEEALKRHAEVRTALVKTYGERSQSERLVAYVVPTAFEKSAADPQSRGSYVEASSYELETKAFNDPIKRLEFKLAQHGILRTDEKLTQVRLIKPVLDESAVEQYEQRQTRRSFMNEPVSFEPFSRMLNCLLQVRLDCSPLPKYMYGSAGGLYPVQTYLYIKPDRVEGLAAGVYYYHPKDHILLLISANARIDRSVHSLVNQSAFDESAFSVFFIGQLNAITPVYGEKARDFCLIEAGLMSQLIETAATAYEIGVCQIGGLDFEKIRDLFSLEQSQILLHSLVGGKINNKKTEAPLLDNSDPKTSSGLSKTKEESADSVLVEKLRRFLTRQLPEYMVPAAFVIMDALPLSANGKIDLSALPAPNASFARTLAEDDRPSTDMEKRLIAIVKETLKVAEVGVNQRFFDLGGNSVHMIQVLNRLQKITGIDVPAVRIFEHPTIRSLAAFLSSENDTGPSLQSSVDRGSRRRASIKGLGRKR